MNADALYDLAKTVSEALVAAGWCGDYNQANWFNNWSTAQTGSMYATYTRDGIDSDGDESTQKIIVRVADHESAYCREDVCVLLGDKVSFAAFENFAKSEFESSY